jgi:hypothetical protein
MVVTYFGGVREWTTRLVRMYSVAQSQYLPRYELDDWRIWV